MYCFQVVTSGLPKGYAQGAGCPVGSMRLPWMVAYTRNNLKLK